MTKLLDLPDIQGNIVRAYGRFGFPFARYYFFNIPDADSGRGFLRGLEVRVTTAERWAGGPDNAGQVGVPVPKVTLNVGLSWGALAALEVPVATISGLPHAFIEGMVKRARILGDEGDSALEHWDPVWRDSAQDPAKAVHVMVALNAQMTPVGDPVPELEAQADWLLDLARESGVRLLTGHAPGQSAYQQAGANLVAGADGSLRISPKEHFGFVDGIGDPVFAGQFEPDVEAMRVAGRGKLTRYQRWEPLETGEFLLGHVDESQELPPTTLPVQFTQNGSFMAFRKLHQNVSAFETYMAEQAAKYARIMDVPEDEAAETLRAKMVGRWSNGVPLLAAPAYADMQAFEAEWSDIPAIQANRSRSPAEQKRLQKYKSRLIDFRYRDDPDGTKCPFGAHIRRGNVRDFLDPRLTSDNPGTWDGSAISNRRRILRRGLPYGSYDPDKQSDDQEHGVIFLAVCTSLERQFEFVLQQWINYGMDMSSGNDTCPLLGTRPEGAKFTIAADPGSGKPPFIMDAMPRFVTTRGGEYFFLPSVTALRMMASGTVDPT
jgi:Dyp-type peroxidase family